MGSVEKPPVTQRPREMSGQKYVWAMFLKQYFDILTLDLGAKTIWFPAIFPLHHLASIDGQWEYSWTWRMYFWL